MKSLIYDFEKVNRFIETIFSGFNKFGGDRVAFLSLIIRGKYLKQNSNFSNFPRKEIMSQIDIASNKQILLNKIIRLSYVENMYKLFDNYNNECYAPFNSFVLYVDPNIKSSYKATMKFVQEVIKDNIDLTLSNCNESEYTKFTKVKLKLMSNIQKSNAKREFSYVLIDIDTKDINILKMILNYYIKHKPVWTSETFSGYHIIITNKNGKIMNQLFKNLNKLNEYSVEIKTKTFFTPLPGTYQGGFKVREINYEDVIK